MKGITALGRLILRTFNRMSRGWCRLFNVVLVVYVLACLDFEELIATQFSKRIPGECDEVLALVFVGVLAFAPDRTEYNFYLWQASVVFSTLNGRGCLYYTLAPLCPWVVRYCIDSRGAVEEYREFYVI